MVSDLQRTRERSIEIALVMDAAVLVSFLTSAIVAGSLTMLAEFIRGTLMTGIEFFALLVMRRIHRGQVAILEFGSGKLEQLVNLGIACGMLAGAVWIAIDIPSAIANTEDAGSPAAFAFGAIALAVNGYVNVIAYDSIRRAARGGGSVIMRGQLQARVVKLVSSAFVLVTMTVAALSFDGVVMAWSDAIGALFVSGFIVYNAVDMLRSGLPELIDQSVNEEVQAAINRTLARHYEAYERLDHVRTRRSGEVVHAEIALGFKPTLTMAEVSERIAAMKASLREEVRDADVSILAVSC